MAQHRRRQADDLLVMALACGATVDAAARKASVGVATVYRRLQDPEFIQRLQKVQAGMVERIAASLTAVGMEAVKTLMALLGNSIPPAVRLGAARAIIELGTKQRESVELERRIAVGEPHNGEATPMKTNELVQRLSIRLRELDATSLPIAEKARLTQGLSDAFLRAIAIDDLNKRMEALEAVLKSRKDQGR